MTLYRAAGQAVDESLWFSIDAEVVSPCLDFSVLGNDFPGIDELVLDCQPDIGFLRIVSDVLALD